MAERLEPMAAFFDARVDGYDQHMLDTVVGCKRGYPELARLLPEGVKTLLDLGCGTGLELETVFARFPNAEATGYDLSEKMLAECRRKLGARRLTLHRESYLTADFGREAFDAAISFESLHHFTHAQKLALYRRVYAALKPGGVFVYGDYFVETDAEERAMREEYDRLRGEQDVRESVHFDTPFTIAHELRVLAEAGFADARRVWREGGMSLVAARRDA